MNQDTYRMPTDAELAALLRQAHQMRAQAMLTFFTAAGRTLGRSVRAAASWLATVGLGMLDGYRRHQVYQELSRMSDGELARIGLTRHDIAAFAAGNYLDRSAQSGDPAPAVSATVTPLKPAAAPAAPQIREAA